MKKTFLLAFSLFALSVAPASAGEVFDKIMKTGTIRCGYYNWPPFLTKNLTTGVVEGIAPDLFAEIGKQLSLKIEWTEEVSTGSMFEGYANHRYDMICGPLSLMPARARASDFTDPFIYASAYLYVRKDDTRFDHKPEAANDPSVKYIGMDGEYSAIIGQEDFPKAKYASLPGTSLPSELLMSIATKKVDVTATEPVQFLLFDRANPGLLKQAEGPPLHVIPMGFSVPFGEEPLKSMLNVTLRSLTVNGVVDKILKKYPDYDATLIRPAKGYDINGK